ncbi:MAG: SDR family NAD(P)-dependent oxidoreductase [Acidimicrobiales bacterium]
MNDAFGRPQSVIVLGGSSDIARAVVRRLAGARCKTVVLAGRDPERLSSAAKEALDAGASLAPVVLFDAHDVAQADLTVSNCFAAAEGPVDLVIVAVGDLGSPDSDERDPARTADLITVGFTWPASALTAIAATLREQGHGRIVVLSSVAGVRVRRSNFAYGSAKAGLDGFSIGLAESLRGSGVIVQVVRPGFVRTKMTEGLKPAPFSTGPEEVADAIIRGIETDAQVVWSPGLLRWIFMIMRNLPQSIWRKLPG